MKNNNSNTKKINGVALIMVITTIGLVGIVMLFLSSASNTMMYQANDFYLQACERNLTGSGLNWAKTNIKKGTITDFNNTILLDVNDMNILRSSLELKIISHKEGQNEVQIKTSCGRARQNLTNQVSFSIEGSH